MTVRILRGDCLDVLKTLPDASVHSVVTDPPYGLSFMGRAWDHGIPGTPYWIEALRVIKPGAYLVAFGGTRTYHRLACAIEDAGFEIRDQLAWVYGSGFPKGTDKAKIPEAWQGWNTALKPAWEPIVLARKPMNGSLAVNLQAHGCGAMNIDGCRVGTENWTRKATNNSTPYGSETTWNTSKTPDIDRSATGRWPANVLHDGSEEVVAHFPDAPGQIADASSSSRKTQHVYGDMKRGNGRDGEPSADSANGGVVGFNMRPGARRGDEGSAARFFYCAKASRADRNDGLHSMPKKPLNWSSGEQNHHPTVKPTELMAWLVKLVTPPGGTVLDPFMGSGSTGRGAVMGSFDFIGVEIDSEYAAIAEARIRAISPLFAEVT